MAQEPPPPEAPGAGVSPSSNAQELRQAVYNRIDGLRAELDELLGKQVDTGRHGITAALRTLRRYPDDMRVRVESRTQRSTRPAALTRLLRADLQAVVQATAQVQQWFAAPYSDTVPVALHDAVRDLSHDLSLGIDSAVITIGPPARLETVVSDIGRTVYGDTEVIEPPPLPFALVSIPRHEASSPRWWPVILGHELAHLLLRRLERDIETTSALSAEAMGDLDLSESSTFLLQKLDLIRHFPIPAMKDAVRAEREDRLRDGAATDPPGFGDPLNSAPSSSGSDIASAVVKRLEIANAWLQEVACDLAMVRSFGPAGVASMANYLTAIGDFSRIGPSHPPGVWRIRTMIEYLGSVTGDVFAAVLAPWTDLDSEQFEDAQPLWVKLITDFLHEHLPAVASEVATWPISHYDASSSDRHEAALLAQRQLSVGLPPFAADPTNFLPGIVEGGCPDNMPSVVEPAGGAAGGQPVELLEADVINAGWAVAAHEALSPPIPTDRLVLKSLESLRLLRFTGVEAVDFGVDDTGDDPPILHQRGATLARDAIVDRLRETTLWRRLIVTPCLSDTVQRGGVDLRLGNRFIVFQRTGTSSFDAHRADDPRAVQRLVERGWGVPFVLHPGEVVLAAPLEYVALPVDLAAQVITRSSYGRLGLITATAVQVHPLYRGCLTLELVNLGTVPLNLYPGERVAQLVFLNVDSSSSRSPSRVDLFGGTYACPTGPEFPHVSLDEWVRRTIDEAKRRSQQVTPSLTEST